MLKSEELFGGKIKAMADRRHPRDLYDLLRFTNVKLKHNPEILRKLAVLFASTMDRDFRRYAMDRFDAINAKDLERSLYPLLKAGDRPTAPAMLKAVSPLLGAVLDHSREAGYLEAMAAGRCFSRTNRPSSPAFGSIRHFSGKPRMLRGMSHVQKRIPDSPS